jgi:hypothetical protein
MSIVNVLDQKILELSTQLHKLQEARDILNGLFTLGLQEPQLPPSTVVEPVKPVAPRPIVVQDNAPRCSACDKGRLRPSIKKAPSGVYINMLQCDDGGCNNEVY